MSRLTLSEIASAFASADGVAPFSDSPRLNQLRHLDKRGCLVGGKPIDGRGTKAFPIVEAYRARILCALFDMGLDAVAVSSLLSTAETRPGDATEQWPARTRTDAGRVWRGFEDVVRGVRDHGEKWTLELRLSPTPGRRPQLRARFVWLDASDQEYGDAFGAVVLHLPRLFADLPSLEG